MSDQATDKKAHVIRHVGFEDLGLFLDPLQAAGYAIVWHEAGVDDLTAIDPCQPDLLIVLGGPVGVYESDFHPFLADETALLTARLDRSLPTLGICLGAQLIAKALGSEVFPSGIKEIGWAPLILTEAGSRSPLRHLDGLPVLHWHGDTFDLPHGARHLALTDACAQQAFSVGTQILGLQFHAEVNPAKGIEKWLIGHACEIGAAGLDPWELRRQTAAVESSFVGKAQQVLVEWLAHLPSKTQPGISHESSVSHNALIGS